MRKENILLDKSFAFSLRIIKVYKYLTEYKREYVLSKQLLRSGTSIGSNAEEGNAAQSKNDFISKLQISYKESHETHYWIRLMRDSGFIENKSANSLLSDLEELIKLLRVILQKTKEGVKNSN